MRSGRRRRTADERCRYCGAPVIWARLDETGSRPGQRIAIDLVPVRAGGTMDLYWSAAGERLVRVLPRGSSSPLRRPHFATCSARDAAPRAAVVGRG